MITEENPYGVVKRLKFFEEVIEKLQPASVLDIGCGTGNQVTLPLAERFSSIHFLGVDDDTGSIAYAKKTHILPNLQFSLVGDMSAKERFDLVIASEVVEHVEKPLEFLESLRQRLTPEGVVIVTLPNGYGPFEYMQLLEFLLRLSGIFRVLQVIKNAIFGRARAVEASVIDTAAVSPHINFFSYSEINSLFLGAGLKVLKYRPRTFLCGFFFDQLLRTGRCCDCNSRVADSLPSWSVSDWMFVLERGPAGAAAEYSPGFFDRFHRYINKRVVTMLYAGKN